jgi:flagellar biogenesis protein FliO
MDVIRQFAGIALTLAMLAAALWWLRKKGNLAWRGGPSARMIDVIESRTLAPGHTLHMVRLADRVMALATHGGGCTLLESRPFSELRQPQERP